MLNAKFRYRRFRDQAGLARLDRELRDCMESSEIRWRAQRLDIELRDWTEESQRLQGELRAQRINEDLIDYKRRAQKVGTELRDWTESSNTGWEAQKLEGGFRCRANYVRRSLLILRNSLAHHWEVLTVKEKMTTELQDSNDVLDIKTVKQLQS